MRFVAARRSTRRSIAALAISPMPIVDSRMNSLQVSCAIRRRSMG
jgi:hypothetical protein